MKKVESVPDLVRETLECMSEAKDYLSAALREVIWAYQDLQQQGGLPVESNEPMDPNDPRKEGQRDAILAEFASRAVLPHHLPKVLERIEKSLECVKAMVEVVKPLPAKVKEEKRG